MLIRTTARTAAAAAALLITGLSLTACAGGGGSNGVYYSEINENGGWLAQVTIDGSQVSYQQTHCSTGDIPEDRLASGEISDDTSTVIWTQENECGIQGQDDFIPSESMITIDGVSYHKEGSSVADQALVECEERR